MLNRIKSFFIAKNKNDPAAELLPVTIIIPAYNEKDTLERKIQNTLSIDYPDGKLDIIFVTDGSADGSDEIVSRYPSLRLLHQGRRSGKLAAIKRAMQSVRTPVVIFSDANTDLNRECVHRIVSHYDDPGVGGVAGEKKIISRRSAVGEAEGLYWKYESFMKKQDAGFNTVVGAAGELFSIRTSLFTPLEDNIILDDFVISMKICLQGYKIAYEPEAYATEFPSASLGEEEKRKIRIAAGAYQCIGYLKSALNIFRYPLLSFQYISRRLLRWIVCPAMLVVLFVSNILLVTSEGSHVFYEWLLWGQLFFYLLALMGWVIILFGKRPGLLTIPFYFVFMNYCLVRGFIKFLNHRQTVLWEKSVRQAADRF
jgi:cellulose synthase/poly-beta-1,6-N-acetylglucosamine synthase-like glycosyltransferase